MPALGIKEILLIAAVMMLLFGPSKLPQLGKSLGDGIREYKKAAKNITD